MGVKIHILSDRGLQISRTPVPVEPRTPLPRSGFVQSMLIEGPDLGGQGHSGGATGKPALENASGKAGGVRLFDSMSAAGIHN